MYVPLTEFVLRAPLSPEAALRAPQKVIERRLGRMAIELASGELAGAKDSAGRERALGRYGRRAAFRATPVGLLAGVCMGEIGEELRIETGAPEAWLQPAWGRLAALGRALLDDEEVRGRVLVRVAPSVVRAPESVRWIGPGDPFGELREAELDDTLVAVLNAARDWTRWTIARRACGADDEAADELLLLMIDDGLLLADITPPLIGPPPGLWMVRRLRALRRPLQATALQKAMRELAAGALAAGRAALNSLPGGDSADARAVHGVLVHRPRRIPTLPRAAVARAAALAPLLWRLQEALAPPGAERLAQPALLEALDGVTETFGAGALDLAALASGGYGVATDDVEADHAPAASPPPPALLATIADALLTAAAQGRAQADLPATALAAALNDDGPPAPPTCELFLVPMRAARSAAPPGTGWLLGLHGPAGASWGRFAAALGPPLQRALRRLAAAERRARPFEERLDVAFAPSPALADLCTHPGTRRRALALSGWSAADSGDLTLSDLELVADPGVATPLALRDGERPVVPSPLARVRSTTAPAGVARLLVGWSLMRQHAPWALTLGPLAGLTWLPRLAIDGFVVAPASWQVPPALRDGDGATPAAVRRWRRAAGLPRWVQVGHEDELLPVDLDAPDAAADLRGQERAWEIWPPLGRTIDRGGRRVEAVVALVDNQPDDQRDDAAAAQAIARAGRVPPPSVVPPPAGWRTFKLFGAAAHQDALLATVVGPLARAARRDGTLDRWFFLRYLDGPGRRPHLRLRVHAAVPAALAAFEARLSAALAPARAAGALVTVETADYHPERARFGGDQPLQAAHAVFESDSVLACTLLDAEAGGDGSGPDRTTRLIQSLDALACGLGLDLPGRHALARARRDAEEALAGGVDVDERALLDSEFRARGRALRAALAAPEPGPVGRALQAHATRTARATRGLPADARAALAAPLLHLACVRLLGPDRDGERRAYTFWERALEGILRSAGVSGPVKAR